MKNTTTLLPLTEQANYTLIKYCQICKSTISEVMSLGPLPLVDFLTEDGSSPTACVKYPTPLFYCPDCQLVQIGCLVDPKILFPSNYPYTSATTENLRKNFQELAEESAQLLTLTKDDLVIDIGCNDGTLLSNFKERCRVLGITPEDMGQTARQQNIPVMQSFLDHAATERIKSWQGQAMLITATNVIANVHDVHQTLECILELLKPKGFFVLECDYLFALLEHLQYDTIHHEHLRYYSLTSLALLLKQYGLEIIHAKKIPTHGGSLRVYATRPGHYATAISVKNILDEEKNKNLNIENLKDLKTRVDSNKTQLQRLLRALKEENKRIYGIGAPGRATVLLNYAEITEDILDCVLEVSGSHKIGKYIPGTRIIISNEEKLFTAPPDYALILSWHFAQELIHKLKTRGFKGDFILPLPKPVIIPNQDV